MAKRILLVVGHSRNKQGASNPEGLSEYEFNKGIIMDIVKQDEFRGVDIIPKLRVTSYYNLAYEINAINPDVVISLHCNAFNKETNGTEVLYSTGSKKGKEYAEIFQNNLVDWLRLPDRGIKPITRSDRGGKLLFGVKAPCILLEPLFIDAYTSKELYDIQDEIKEAIIESIWQIL